MSALQDIDNLRSILLGKMLLQKIDKLNRIELKGILTNRRNFFWIGAVANQILHGSRIIIDNRNLERSKA